MVKYKYDAWGNHEAEVADETFVVLAEINPFHYRGYYYDEETDLYFLHTRYYDPEIGWFIDDNILLVYFLGAFILGGLNISVYCFNNPVMFLDDGDISPKPNFQPRKPPRHGANKRKPGGFCKRNVGHSNGE